MSQRTNDTTTPADPLPPVSLYARHAFALVRALDFVSQHFDSFTSLIPEDLQDGVHERQVAEALHAAERVMQTYALRTMLLPDLTDDLYRAELADAPRFAEYRDVAELR
jgi:hypothetical protein